MKLFKPLLFVNLLSPLFVFSQNNESIDSLIQVYEKSTDDTEKFKAALHAASLLNLELETEKATDYLQKANQYLDSTKLYQYAYYLLTEGNILANENYPDSAEQKYLSALSISEKLNDECMNVASHAALGTLYSYQSKVYLSNSYWFNCIPYYQKTNDLAGLQTAYNEIGFNYSIYDEYDLSNVYYLLLYDLAAERNDIEGMSTALINSGYSHEMLGEYDKALDQYRKSVPLHQAMGIEEYVAYSYVLMGTVFAKTDQIDSAFYYLGLSNEILVEKDDKYGLSYVHYGYSLLYEKTGDLQKSESHAREGLRFSQESFFIANEIKVLDQLHKICYKQKKYQPAYESYQQFIYLRDSLKNPLNSREIAGLEYKYEYQNLHLADSLKFQEEQHIAQIQHKEELRRYWIYAIAGITLLSLLLIFMVAMIRNAKIRKLKNQELSEKNEEIAKQKMEVETAHFELKIKNQEVLDSITYAKRIQSAILPPAKIVKEYLQQSFILYLPKDIVAGDFYWLEQKNSKTLFAVADCTGHGVPGAMVSVVCNNGLNRSVREHGLTDPGKILDKTREIVIQEFEKSEEVVKDGMDIALCSLDGNVLQYAGANNPLWIIRKGAQEVEEIKADKQPIGKYASEKSFTTHTVQLHAGDTIYIFSDGFTDQFGGEKKKKYKAANLKKMLLSIQQYSMDEQKNRVAENFETWKGSIEQLDDVCLIGVRF
ncbi:MAG: SpoIIE family protein phosphatase [Crocinitomicaceae bacterium]|nr:SpoIIE family protein phosphatase [Crocinitomicaceae bacterium]